LQRTRTRIVSSATVSAKVSATVSVSLSASVSASVSASACFLLVVALATDAKDV
jgi:hypothetical protein